MDDAWLEGYLNDLGRELRRRGLFRPQIIEEVRSHLLEAAEQAQQNGLDPADAQRLALTRFGSAQTIASLFAEERIVMMQKILLVVALVFGLFIAYVDSRPTWDDTGITALAVLTSCGLLGMLGLKRPWQWALLIGVWIPLIGIASTHNYGSLLALIFAFAGAYAGTFVRKIVVPA